MVRPRVRIRFTKQADLRLIGHRDLMRCLERLFRRAGLALGMSEGFHPKPRMTFPLALAVGIEGDDEIMELELAEEPRAEELLARLRPQSPPGLRFLSAEILPPGSRKARVRSAVYEVAIPPPRCAGLSERVARLLASPSCPVRRPHRERTVDLRASLEALVLRGEVLEMRLRVDQDAVAGPRDVLAALGLQDLERDGACLKRTTVEVHP
jgi:radical SAM-linked protein